MGQTEHRRPADNHEGGTRKDVLLVCSQIALITRAGSGTSVNAS